MDTGRCRGSPPYGLLCYRLITRTDGRECLSQTNDLYCCDVIYYLWCECITGNSFALLLLPLKRADGWRVADCHGDGPTYTDPEYNFQLRWSPPPLLGFILIMSLLYSGIIDLFCFFTPASSLAHRVNVSP